MMIREKNQSIYRVFYFNFPNQIKRKRKGLGKSGISRGKEVGAIDVFLKDDLQGHLKIIYNFLNGTLIFLYNRFIIKIIKVKYSIWPKK